MSMLFALSLMLANGFAGADPDAYRKRGKGRLAYGLEGIEIGKTYEGFLIQFPDNPDVYLSPSRYRVAYEANALACRNSEAFPIELGRRGQWLKVAFEVLAVRETAVEEPAGSGNWIWRPQFDCEIKGLELAD